MKIVLWVVLAVLLALWSGFAAMSAGLVAWLLTSVADGQINSAAQALGQWPIPAWLSPWVDRAMVADMQVTWLAAVQWLNQVMPSAGSLTAWIVPLIWVLWGVVSLALLVAAVVGHWFLGRMSR
jgi:hypothetical protein